MSRFGEKKLPNIFRHLSKSFPSKKADVEMDQELFLQISM
jgi:Sec-independent protein translocase protein TatA